MFGLIGKMTPRREGHEVGEGLRDHGDAITGAIRRVEHASGQHGNPHRGDANPSGITVWPDWRPA